MSLPDPLATELRRLNDRVRHLESTQRLVTGCWRLEVRDCNLYGIHACDGSTHLIADPSTVEPSTRPTHEGQAP